ncbi:hypothetical protein D3C83_54480 [compost metagenome]
MLLRDQLEDLFEFSQGRLAGVHERVAAAKSRDLGHPRTVVLAVQHHLVIVKGHRAIIRLPIPGARLRLARPADETVVDRRFAAMSAQRPPFWP